MRRNHRIRFSDDRECSFDEMMKATHRGILVAKQVLPLWQEMIADPEIARFLQRKLHSGAAIRMVERQLGFMLRVAPMVNSVYREAKETGVLPRDSQAKKALEIMGNLYLLQKLDLAFKTMFHSYNEGTQELVDRFRKAVEPFSRGLYKKTARQFKMDADAV